VSDSRHADTFNKVEPATTTSPQQAPKAAHKASDNEAAAARAEAQREYTAGGGDAEGLPQAAAPATARLDAVIARVRRTDRPSPFGTAHFPPLPVPPGLDSER
jgi:hypothetical protein